MKSEALTKEFIKTKVTNDDAWASKAILALYARQTEDEQTSGLTKHKNSMGFNGLDAWFLTSLALRLKSGRPLTPKQLKVAKPKLGKYAGQLLIVAEEKQ